MGYYLMIKTIDQNGVRYLCKCRDNKNHISYKGSGVFWRKILNSHPTYTISTTVIGHYESAELLKEAGLYYSELYNVVGDKSWANCIPESGDGGDTVGGKIYGHDPITLTRRAFVNESEFPDNWVRGNPPRGQGITRKIHNVRTKELKTIGKTDILPEGYAEGGVKGLYRYGPKNQKICNNADGRIYIKSSESIPEGYSRGTGCDGTTKNKIGCHNPTTMEKVYISKNSPVPNGFVIGLFPTTGKKLETPYGSFESVQACMNMLLLTRYEIEKNIKNNQGWFYIKE